MTNDWSSMGQIFNQYNKDELSIAGQKYDVSWMLSHSTFSFKIPFVQHSEHLSEQLSRLAIVG
ncbi:hypothetical protein BLOT_002962 [Blomia tropicalis]|nr:hypothetical protein BLOT_002962 [Blomia tropicalis]